MLKWVSECNFKYSFKAKQHARVGFRVHAKNINLKLSSHGGFRNAIVSIVLKLDFMPGLDSECILKHDFEAKQHATVGFGMRLGSQSPRLWS